jgi:hypothetical protein
MRRVVGLAWFHFEPSRLVQDAFMNTHNPPITSLLGCNSNVMVGMNVRRVLYVTGYNVKSQQKEERVAYERVSQVLTNIFPLPGKQHNVTRRKYVEPATLTQPLSTYLTGNRY